MEQCEYETIEDVFSWKIFSRQLMVSSVVWISYVVAALGYGATTVIIPQLRREANSTDAVSDEMASWISSIHGYAAIPWVIIMPTLSSFFGRKYVYFVINLCSLASFIFFYCSTTVIQLLLAEVLQGVLISSQITLSIIIVAEYTSPKYRGMFLTLKSASFVWGLWIANAIGTFFHWKVIGILGMILASYNAVNILFWKESPYWLAEKNRYEECGESHRWLKGNDEASEKELQELIRTQKKYEDMGANKHRRWNSNVIGLFKTVISKKFYKPFLLCFVILTLYHCSAKFICSIYAIDIIKKITSSESTAYTGMLILDGVTVLGMYAGSILSKFYKRRTLLLGFSSCGIAFLFLISLYLYLVKLSILIENKYISIILLMLYSMCICCGPLIFSTSIFGELAPLKSRTFFMVASGLHYVLILSTTLKLAPGMFIVFGLHGTLFFYAIISSILIFLIYKYLPETKDKTLVEIDGCMTKSEKNYMQQTSLRLIPTDNHDPHP